MRSNGIVRFRDRVMVLVLSIVFGSDYSDNEFGEFTGMKEVENFSSVPPR